MSKRRIVGLLLCAIALAATALVAARRGPDAAPVTESLRPGMSAAQIVTQEDTTPFTLEEMDPDTREALRRDTEGLVQVYHPDGSVSMNLEGRFQTTATVRIDEDGRPMVTCIEAPEAAVSPAPAMEVK